MPGLNKFVKILPSLYRMGTESVYAFVPDGEKKTADEMEATEVYRQGGTFIYLRYPVETFYEQLLSVMEQMHDRATTLFVDNEGEYIQNWKKWDWFIGDGKLRTGRILSIYGYDILVPQNTTTEIDEEGIHFQCLRFGKRTTEECREAVLSWNGQIRFLFRVGKSFEQEAKIRYEMEVYDSNTRRNYITVCTTGEPRWEAGNRAGHTESGRPETEVGSAYCDEIWACANVCWEIDRETTFVFPKNTRLFISNYPPMEMKTCIFRFARGSKEYYPAISGSGRFLESADVTVGSKGFFRISKGDEMELVIAPEGYLGDRKRCAEVSALKVYAPFYAAEVEMEVECAVPVFPAANGRIRESVSKLLDRKLQKIGRPVYHRNIWCSNGTFETCISGQDIVWYNLHRAEKMFPEIALCHMKQELAHVVMADEFFMILDDGAKELFAVPYTIDRKRLDRAEGMGYPKDKCDRLMQYYPEGRTFLSEDSFRRGIEQAQCPYTEQIRAACHHYRISVEGREVVFSPDIWNEEGIILAAKKGKRYSVWELIEDAEAWSFPSEGKEAAQALLKKSCKAVQKPAWESVVRDPEWEGSIAAGAGIKQDGQGWLLALQATNGTVIFESICR